jgi:hypothetical protein
MLSYESYLCNIEAFSHSYRGLDRRVRDHIERGTGTKIRLDWIYCIVLFLFGFILLFVFFLLFCFFIILPLYSFFFWPFFVLYVWRFTFLIKLLTLILSHYKLLYTIDRLIVCSLNSRLNKVHCNMILFINKLILFTDSSVI